MRWPSRRRFLAAACSAAATGLVGCRGGVDRGQAPTETATPAPVPTTRPPPEGKVTTIARFDGLGPVNLVVAPNGDLYMAMGVSGQVRRLPAARTGEAGLTADATELVTTLDTGNGFLYALDILDGTLYAALSSRQETTHGVWELPLDSGEPSRLAALDPELRLRGLLVDADRSRAFVTHARRGVISTVGLEDGTVTQWLDHRLFDASIRGPTGLVRTGGDMYATNNERGRVVRIPIDEGGSAGTPSVLADDTARLSGASGLTATDQALYVSAANLNRIVRVGLSGNLRTLATDEDGLDLPTDVALAPGGDELIVANFGFEEMVGLTGRPSLMRVTL